jgi:hypothetical protein
MKIYILTFSAHREEIFNTICIFTDKEKALQFVPAKGCEPKEHQYYEIEEYETDMMGFESESYWQLRNGKWIHCSDFARLAQVGG